jgi:Tfp pilus assembly protein PilO
MRKGQLQQLVSVILLLLLVVGVFVLIMPMRDKVTDLKADKQVVADQLQGLQSEYEDLEALSSEVATSSTVKNDLLDSVPVGYSQDELILELADLADDAEFDLNAMNFAASVDQASGNFVSVSANFDGDYGDLIKFLQALEGADRLMRVSSLSVQLTSTEEVVFNLNIEAYYQ